MKKIVLTLIITLVSLSMINAQTPAAPAPAAPAPAVNTSETVAASDSTIQVQSGDKIVTIAISDLKRLAKEHLHLDDTVLTTDDKVDEAVYADSAAERQQATELAVRGMNLAEMIVKSIACAAIAVVFISLLFYFLHRRRKYRTIDRAIASGYPLPPEFFGKRSISVPKQPTTVYVTQVMPPQNTAANGATDDSAPAPAQSANPMNNVTDWKPFRKGVMLTIIGFCLMLFFWIVGAGSVAALMLILVFFGLSKIFFAYQEQQSAKNYWQNQQWTPQQPQQQQQPEQPQAEAPEATTPPPFTPQQ